MKKSEEKAQGPLNRAKRYSVGYAEVTIAASNWGAG
jgi:hypothetical protein